MCNKWVFRFCLNEATEVAFIMSGNMSHRIGLLWEADLFLNLAVLARGGMSSWAWLLEPEMGTMIVWGWSGDEWGDVAGAEVSFRAWVGIQTSLDRLKVMQSGIWIQRSFSERSGRTWSFQLRPRIKWLRSCRADDGKSEWGGWCGYARARLCPEGYWCIVKCERSQLIGVSFWECHRNTLCWIYHGTIANHP